MEMSDLEKALEACYTGSEPSHYELYLEAPNLLLRIKSLTVST